MKFLIIGQNKKQEKTHLINTSKLHMVCPVIFEYMDLSFNVFMSKK